MRKSFLVMLMLMSIVLLNAQNLVQNGTFETWTVADPLTTMPNSWTRGAGTVGTHYLYATDVVRGNVLRLTDPTSVASKRFSSDSPINIAEAGTYSISFWVKGTVRLRYVALVKGTESPANTASLTNHYTTITGYTSGTKTDWTKVAIDINVPTTATFGEDYKFHLVWSNTNSTNTSDFLLDDIIVEKFTPSTSSKLTAITITPAEYTTSNPPSDFNLGGFTPETYNYTFTSSYHAVPLVGAVPEDPTATVNITQAESFSGTATIIVTASDNSSSTYTVEMVKHPGFISGMTWDASNIAGRVEWAEINGLYFRSTGKNKGNIWAIGNTSMRCNSTSGSGFYATTPVLTNGAGSMIFFIRNWDITQDDSPVVVLKSTNGTDWTEIHRIVPVTAEWEVWKEVTVMIYDNSPTLQVRIAFEKTIETSGQIYIDDVIIEPYSSTTWIGTVSSDWTTTGNWSNGLPDNETPAVIGVSANNPELSTTTTIAGLTIEPLAGLTINSSGSLTVNADFVLKSSTSGSGTLINKGQLTVDGKAKAEIYLTGSPDASGRQWWYVSSPVSGATSAVFNPEGENNMGYFDETLSTPNYVQIDNNESNLEAGRGYLLQNKSNATYIYSGSSFTTDDITLNLTRTGISAGQRGFHLTGNPYPAYLDWKSAFDETTTSNIRPTIWYRTSTGEGNAMQYQTYNAASGIGLGGVTGIVPPMQGFWMKVNADAEVPETVSTGTIQYTVNKTQHKQSGNNSLKTKAISDMQLLRLEISNGSVKDELVLIGMSSAADSFDNYDSEKLSNNNPGIPEIYSSINKQEIAINSVSSIENKQFDLGIRPGKEGLFTLSSTESKGLDNLIVLLKDNMLDSETILTEGTSYTFYSNDTPANNRFTVAFRLPGTITDVDKTNAGNTGIYVNTANQLVIETVDLTSEDIISVYNITGQLIASQQNNGNTTIIDQPLTAGVYLVVVKNHTHKVIIKH